jgi:hypothetical protein
VVEEVESTRLVPGNVVLLEASLPRAVVGIDKVVQLSRQREARNGA